MLCLIDNYDSFTYNLVHYLHELDVDVRVVLNDEMSAKEVLALGPTHIVLSPGAGTPDESGISKELLELAAQELIPTLGVCLGHEVIGEVFGGRVNHARRIMHGKTSRVWHSRADIFSNLPSSFLATRYHSLVIDKDTLPDCLKVTAWTEADGDGEGDEIGEIMAVSHKTLPIFGVQFHPESIMSEHGHLLLANFFGIDKAVSTEPASAAGGPS
ncbi:anthranilate synthase component II [Sorangium sp. So ce1000]|uniref:anthranilate synthase component II n=1 Tax=Sorangium sp. So ce1000 TaxID=3133325 RepID=UPI003F5D9913